MNKRGLSNVIVTLILIAISLIAVGLIWVTVQNLIESETEQISLGFITVDLEIKNVKVESDGSVKISVGRKIGDGEITGLKFIVSDGINTETIDKENINLDQLEEKTFTLTSGELGEVVFIKEISVAPVFTLESGKEKIGNVVDIEVLTNKQIIENLGAVSWWRFEGNARDEIGDNDGTLNGDVSFVDGKFGKSASFDGSGDYVSHATTGISATQGTLVGWVRPNTATSWGFWQTHDSSGQDFADWIAMFMWVNGNGPFYFRMGGSGCCGNDVTYVNTNIPINQWSYLTFTWEGTEMKSYVNGVLVNSKSPVILQSMVDPGARIGWSYNSVIDGLIDEVMIFNKALSDKEVEALYNLDLS